MSLNSKENKRIAKNSAILYVRLIVSTVVGLYTSRVVLLQLGAEDYGLYAVVGGIISLLNVLNSAMASSTSRYLAVEIGRGEKGNTNKVFNTSLIIHIVLAIVLVVVGEIFGIWYVNNYLNIDSNRIPEAILVLHFTILSTVFSIITVPFIGLVTVMEKFSVNVSIEIFRTLLKLAFVLSLIIYAGDKLQFYTITMSIVAILPSLLFVFYCYKKYIDIVRWRINKVKNDYYGMINFTGWMVLGTIAFMGVRQGAALIINLFFGTVLNASFGIASLVSGYVEMFVRNINQATVPQIMKSHSSGNDKRSIDLVYSISKYSFFLMLLPAVPLLLSIDAVLIIWLKEVPEYTKQFVILMIINGLISSLGSGFNAVIQATGKVKNVQIWYSILMLGTLPITYLLFYFGAPPYSITLSIISATILLRIIFINAMVRLSTFKTKEYIVRTIYPSSITVLAILPLYFFRKLFADDILSIFLFICISVIFLLAVIYVVGMNKREKQIINNQLVLLKERIIIK